MCDRRRIVVILGLTASGKSELAVAVARELRGEIVSADSMQVYRQLDAGTAKPSAEQRAAVPHHLIDVVDPTEPFTVADWLARAEAVIAGLHAAGKVPVVVGGTNLYLKALLEGMFAAPGGDARFRESLRDTPSDVLHDRLRGADPEAADRIHSNDRKRMIRALEVHHLTGRPISAQQTQWLKSAAATQPGIKGPTPGSVPAPYRHDPILVGLRWPVEAINRRINRRAKLMLDPPGDREDLVTETRRLLAAGLLGAQAREAIGTRQVLDHLAGRCSRAEALERIKIDTRRFAKAQRTWLKRYRGVRWFDAEHTAPEQLARRVIRTVRAELERAGSGE